MSVPISQSDAADLFDLPTEVLYVCDGKKECGNPSCSDWNDKGACHHTSDLSHALYDVHHVDEFDLFPAARCDGCVILCVEPIRG